MNKKDLLPIILIFALFLAYPVLDRMFVSKIFPPKARPVPAATADTVPAEATADATEATGEAIATAPDANPAPEAAEVTPATVDAAPAIPEESNPLPENVISLENSKLRLAFSSHGAGILNAAMIERNGDALVYPLHKNSADPVSFDFSERLAAAPLLPGLPARASFEVLQSDTSSVTYVKSLPNGLRLTRRFSLGEAYQLQLEDRFENTTAATLTLSGYGLQSGRMTNLPGEESETRGVPLLGVDTLTGSQSVEYWAGKFEKWFPSLDPVPQLQTVPGPKEAPGPVDWVAVKNKYFTQILTPGTYAESCAVEALRGASVKTSSMIFFSRTVTPFQSLAAALVLPAQEIPAGQTLTQTATFYIGPKTYAALKANGPHQEDVLQLGFWGFIGTLILKVMVWFHDHIWPYNYGLAIILLTFLIRIIFWPLNHKSMMSTRRMQEIQPLMTALKEKYKGDPQRQQQEMMKLYKEHKINPMGGCLPMLIQIPVFFALFVVLRGAIELRFSSFLWISDLSTPENLFAGKLPIALNILPIFMGVTMWLQQKMTPTSDPQQQKMMMMMPVIFTVMFYSFPSGLSLYWSINQVMMIVQLAMMKKPHPATPAAA